MAPIRLAKLFGNGLEIAEEGAGRQTEAADMRNNEGGELHASMASRGTIFPPFRALPQLDWTRAEQIRRRRDADHRNINADFPAPELDHKIEAQPTLPEFARPNSARILDFAHNRLHLPIGTNLDLIDAHAIIIAATANALDPGTETKGLRARRDLPGDGAMRLLPTTTDGAMGAMHPEAIDGLATRRAAATGPPAATARLSGNTGMRQHEPLADGMPQIATKQAKRARMAEAAITTGKCLQEMAAAISPSCSENRPALRREGRGPRRKHARSLAEGEPSRQALNLMLLLRDRGERRETGPASCGRAGGSIGATCRIGSCGSPNRPNRRRRTDERRHRREGAHIAQGHPSQRCNGCRRAQPAKLALALQHAESEGGSTTSANFFFLR